MAPQTDLLSEIIVDNFAGGGGASTGIELATGRTVDIAINHDPDAILMHKTNHPHTEHLQASVWDVDPETVCRGRPVGLAWFSPDCKHFSKAKGGKPVDKNIRGLAWIVLRWAGTVRPRVIILENVEEFQTWGPVRRGKPVKAKAGQTFEKWKQQLFDLGYDIEHRELIAADYGAPTIRKRFFLIARCDGQPIVWPEPTHSKDGADGKAKWRSAAEIIDWTLPCPSIFAGKQEIKAEYGLDAVRPLADNTLRRIIRGVDKFTIKAANPFIVQVNHGGGDRAQSVEEALPTVTGKHGYGVVEPVISPFTATNTSNSVGTDARDPVNTARTGGGAGQMLISSSLIQYHTEQSEKVRGQRMTDPIQTVDASNRYALTAANLVEYFGNGNPLDISEPLHTVTSKDREALTIAHIQKYFGGVIGTETDNPLPSVTAVDHNALCLTTAIRYQDGQNLKHWPEIRALLNQHCGYTLADNEVLLINIGGAWYFIADIGLRMLTAKELYAAQGFPSDYIIDRDYMGNVYGKSKQVARCGNAVPPPFATALVRANLPEWCGKEITTMAALEREVAV